MADDVPLSMGEGPVGRFAERLLRLEVEVGTLRTTITAKVEPKLVELAPKPTPWMTVVGLSFTVLVAVLGAWWGLSERFANRPTVDQVEKLIRAHVETGHPSANQQMQGLREEQINTRNSLDSVQRELKALRDELRK